MQLFLISALVGLVAGCSDTCTNTIFTTALAPDGQHRASSFQRDCGATTGFSTQISLVGPGENVTSVGNAFRSDDDHGAARAGSWGGPWADMKGLAADHLLVRYAAKSRIFQRADYMDGVRLTYQEMPR